MKMFVPPVSKMVYMFRLTPLGKFIGFIGPVADQEIDLYYRFPHSPFIDCRLLCCPEVYWSTGIFYIFYGTYLRNGRRNR